MKYLSTSIALVGLMLGGAVAQADDAMTPAPTPPASGAPGAPPASDSTTTSTPTSQHQMMKDCMARQKQADSSMSRTDMRKACKAQVKAEMQNMSVPPTK